MADERSGEGASAKADPRRPATTPDVCPVLTPEQARWSQELRRIERDMLDAVESAMRRAAEDAKARLGGAGPDLRPPPPDYFVAVVQQAAFTRMCGADPQTFAGGDVRIAGAVIRNNQNIAMHYWGADPADLAPPERDS
ncbi:hypothetical protein [Chenggangzhangella methanolivorans]|uniref:Uncharacterized protein n=1 Tax=Chenggangzhangella methanolivorans TaxID=1437009 RepID=A0A9E6RBQ0_9HYPH|nr:hypothetical protein [Chenggangzhangella methanolivorans]QZO01844.1 hypothetical protein K6K41_11095 [Chenggangzhangella methanolivorans]